MKLLNTALLATPHVAGHSTNGKINGTIMLIDFLQNHIEIKNDQKKLNLEIMKNLITSKIRSQRVSKQSLY